MEGSEQSQSGRTTSTLLLSRGAHQSGQTPAQSPRLSQFHRDLQELDLLYRNAVLILCLL